MRHLARSLVSILCLLLAATVSAQAPASAGGDRSEVWSALYTDYCGVCHGDDLTGEAQGTPLIGGELNHGDSVEELAKTISEGVPGTGMEAFGEELTATQIQTLAIFIAEERAQMTFVDFKVAAPLEVPTEPLSSELHDFRIETVIDDIDPLPYSIAPLPDGRILLTEKMRGLSVSSRRTASSPTCIAGAPDGIRRRARTAGSCASATAGSSTSHLIPTSRTTAGSTFPTATAVSDCNEASRVARLPSRRSRRSS